MQTLAEKINAFNRQLRYDGPLPEGIQEMNPFRDHPQVLRIAEAFYNKYYNDCKPRKLILGINPGRFGAGATGVPFTDPKRLQEFCGMNYEGKQLHEPSSEYVYSLITAFGGVEQFYGEFYIHSICPLGLTRTKQGGSVINYNYYDSKELQEMLMGFIEWNVERQIEIAGTRDICFCLGTGKNYQFLARLNQRKGLFKRIVALEHPRFVMQYKSKEKAAYIVSQIDKLRTS